MQEGLQKKNETCSLRKPKRIIMNFIALHFDTQCATARCCNCYDRVDHVINLPPGS